MTNHMHLLLKSGKSGLSTFMRRLLSGYAQYYNRRHHRVGHLCQNRYRSIICEEKAYFSQLVAYIHLNPLRAGIVSSLEELASYLWSGHSVLMGRQVCDWFDRDYSLQFFGSKEGPAKIDTVCQRSGCTSELLRSSGRRSLLPELRNEIASKFVKEFGVSPDETARQIGVTTSAVCVMQRR
jgi:hypothetical protein